MAAISCLGWDVIDVEPYNAILRHRFGGLLGGIDTNVPKHLRGAGRGPALGLLLILTLTTNVPNGTLAAGTQAERAIQARLELVSARDHIEGHFLTSQSVYADVDRIYLSGANGKVFVLARDRQANFPVLETLVTNANDPFGRNVIGDDTFLYVGSFDGIHVYRKTHPLSFVTTIPIGVGIGGVGGLAVHRDKLYAATGEANLVVDERHVYLAQLNASDRAFEITEESWVVGRVYGQQFESNTTVVFGRRSGVRLAALPDPPNENGTPNILPNLYVDPRILGLVSAGGGSGGARLYDPLTLRFIRAITRSTNALERRARWLIAGSEGGLVDLYDLGSPAASPQPPSQTVDLPQLTGQTSREAIEIRALWMDRRDNLIFAGSSGGNSLNAGPMLPTFFVLQLIGQSGHS